MSADILEVPWPHNFNFAALPQYDGDFDPTEFLLKYEAVVEDNGRSNTTKAKTLVMALKGAAQTWYSHLPEFRGRAQRPPPDHISQLPTRRADSGRVDACVYSRRKGDPARVLNQNCLPRGPRAQGIINQHHQLRRCGPSHRPLPRFPGQKQAPKHLGAIRSAPRLLQV